MSAFKIGILGNRNDSYEPHSEMARCFRELQNTFDFDLDWIATETLENDAVNLLRCYSGIVAGSGPYRSKQGVINGIRYARTNNIPFLGTCSGFGYAVLEFGQYLFRLPDVFHPNEHTDLPAGETFLQPLDFCCNETHTIHFSSRPETIAAKCYNSTEAIEELSHCSYGVHQAMIPVFAKAGLIVAGQDENGEPKLMEYTPNDFFVITLFLPQLWSKPGKPHPLILRLLETAYEKKI